MSHLGRACRFVGALGVAAGVLTGCGSTSPWASEPINTLAVGEAPDFPQDLDHWTLHAQWSDQPRAFVGERTTVVGPDASDLGFPVSMNGCSSGRFLVRWRALDGLDVQATQVDVEGTVGKTVTGASGWMDLDACSAPAFSLAAAFPDGGNLEDVTVEVQQYFPAP